MEESSMKKMFVFIFLCVVIGAGFTQTIKIGFFQLEPYSIAEEGKKTTGFAVEFWEKYLAPKMGVTVQWVGPLPIPRLYSSLDNGEIDAVLAMASNPERAAKYNIPEKPFMYMKASLTFRKDDPIQSIPNLKVLEGMKIGYVEGANMPAFMENDKISIDKVAQEDYKATNFQKLLRNRIDAILDLNSISNLYEARRLGFQDQIKLLPLPVEPTPIYSIFAKTPSATQFLKKYETALKQISPDVIDQLKEKYK